MVRKILTYSLGILLVLLLGAMIVGQAYGMPVGFSYVETDSMEPTLEPGDGFVAIPAEIMGQIDEGDVIVFEAEAIQGGGLTTHRVVDETERGYITKGDGNPFTDQDNDEPPVKEAQIVAKAFQLNGEVVVIPKLGTAAEGVQTGIQGVQRQLATVFGTGSLLGAQGVAYLFFAATLVWYTISVWSERTTKQRDRTDSKSTGMNTRLIVGAFAVLLMVGATAAMVGPAGTQEYSIVSAEFDSENPTVIPQGESTEVVYPVDNSGVIPIITYLEPASEGVEVTPQESHVGPRTATNATVTLHAPPETGHFRRFVVEHRYLAILPTPVIRTLYAMHPWTPIVAINALIGIPFYLFGVTLVGRGRIRDRSRDRNESLLTRFRRLVTTLY